MRRRRKVFAVLLILVLAFSAVGLSAQNSGGGQGGGWTDPAGNSYSWWDIAWDWYYYIMTYPLIQYGTWYCDDNGCGYV